MNIEKRVKDYSIYIEKLTFINKLNKKFSFRIDKDFSSYLSFNQNFIKKIDLPQGIYTNLKIKLKNKVLSLPITNLKIYKNDTKALFLIWNVRASINNGKFSPVLFVKNQEIPLRGELLFVTSKKENALFFIRVDKNQVCAAMGINGGPVEMALSCVNDKIFILTEKAKDIKVIEVSSFNQTDVFILPFVISPILLTKTPNSLVIGDRDNNRIVAISNIDGALQSSLEIGEKISDISYWENGNKIIVASYNEQMIYFLDDNLKLTKSIKLNCSPSSLFVSNNYLYISETDCNLLSKYNLLTGSIEKEFRLIKPFRIVKFYSNFYITNYYQKYIYIMADKQLSFSRKIKLSVVPDRISVCIRRGWIYVSAKNSNKIEVIDLNSEKSHGIINLGAKPYDLKVGRTSTICK